MSIGSLLAPSELHEIEMPEPSITNQADLYRVTWRDAWIAQALGRIDVVWCSWCKGWLVKKVADEAYFGRYAEMYTEGLWLTCFCSARRE